MRLIGRARSGVRRTSPAARLLAVVGVLGGMLALAEAPVLGVPGTDIAGFDLDAEIVRDGTLDDWATGTGGPGILQQTPLTTDDPCALTAASTGVLICDDVKDDGDIFEGGNKESAPAAWSFKAGQVTPKTDITNVYATGRFDTDGDPILINGMERLPKSGSLNLDFEFNKEVDETTNIPLRSEDDVLVAYDLGGARASDVNAMSIKVFVADANGVYDYDNPDVTVSGAGGATNQGVTGIMNTGDITCGPWGCYDEQGAPATTLPEFSFAEASVNLTDAVGLSDVCFNFVTVRSRASESVTSQLKDTTEPTSFPFCGGLQVRKYIDVGTTSLGTRNPTGLGDSVNDVDTKAEDTLGDLDGWSISVYGPKDGADKGPLVCNGTTNDEGILVCSGTGQDLSSLLPGTYTIEESAVGADWFNTDPGGAGPIHSKEVAVTLGGQTVAYVGNTCYSDVTFSVTSAPTGANAPTSVTVEYEIAGGASQTLALTKQAAPNDSTWSATLANVVKPGQAVTWRFYINGDTTAKKTGQAITAAAGYPTCTQSPSASFGTVTLNGFKYKDADDSGDREAGENGIGGFAFELWNAADYGVAGKSAIASTTSAADGTYSFSGVQVGSYIVDEVTIPTGWAQTEPASNGTRSVSVGLLDTGTKAIGDFGNTPLSQIDVDFTALADLPGGTTDATEATAITCYRDFGTATQTQLGTTSSNSLTVGNLRTSDSVVTCTVTFVDP